MLQVRVCELRAALRAGRPECDAGVLTRGGGYLLRMDGDGLDARKFEQLAATGRRALGHGEHERAAEDLREALELWRGPALSDVAAEPLARAHVARLEALWVQALENRLAADLVCGRTPEIVVELETLVLEHSLREHLWCRLMLALYWSGRQADALGAYQRARELLADRLGVEPGAELRRLQAAVLRQDPALEFHPTPGVTVSTGAPPAREPPHNLPVPLDQLHRPRTGTGRDSGTAAPQPSDHAHRVLARHCRSPPRVPHDLAQDGQD